MIAVPITVTDPASVADALDRATRASELGADLVEWRVDALATSQDGHRTASTLVVQSPLPCILTCRTVDEGGAFDGPDTDREAMLAHMADVEAHPRYVDLEFARWGSSPDLRNAMDRLRAGGSGLILSTHDVHGRPDTLLRRVEEIAKSPCDVVKVAWRARSLRDCLECCDLLADRAKPMIALCMGEYGLVSRVFAGAWGALLTFAALDAESASAPGQPTLDELRSRWGFGRVNPATRLYGLIGDPLGESPGYEVHNRLFQEAGLDGVYLPLPVAAGWESLKATLAVLSTHAHVHLGGASITLPHKQDLLRWATEIGADVDAVAAACGAANTLTVTPDGQFAVANTDAAGIVDPLEARGVALAGAQALILGAGGAARAAAAGLCRGGAAVRVHNRTPDNAQQLVRDLRSRSPRTSIDLECWDGQPSAFDVVVQATPVGMAHGPAPGENAFEVLRCTASDVLLETSTYVETIYEPIETPAMVEARELGCTIITGRDMWQAQAGQQQRLWEDSGVS